MTETVQFPSGEVTYQYGNFADIFPALAAGREILYVTDENIYKLYSEIFSGARCLVLPAGEQTKDLNNFAGYIHQVLQSGLSRAGMMVGIGGGVVTDITGFLASVYMRGLSFGYVPTSLLGMTDAAIGGKTGMNAGLHKNTAGTFHHPGFLLCDTGFLRTLPVREWQNGFAEIIKYACIFDAELLAELQQHNVEWYMQHPDDMQQLVMRCIKWKNEIVQTDEREKNTRKLLNFGHTVGHAIENLNRLSHGQAVSIGMVIAGKISEKILGYAPENTSRLVALLQQYGLPTHIAFDPDEVMNLLINDKKKTKDAIDYILLESPGKAVIHTLPFATIHKILTNYAGDS